ncbi:MAG: DUF4139 domain-containing protein [Bacteroidales bacterium]|jgi:uncharacterized protein (TIGR02231 family)|nr:DUF4139 domain-containing protein [Bacteroidales bacterium]
MKKFMLLLMPALFFCVSASPAEKEIKAAIENVTVYPDRARISHETKVDIPAGTTTLVLGGLSPYIDAGSIQVKGFGDFVILSVNHQNNYLQNLEESPEVKSLRDQIEALQAKVEDEKAAINVLKEKEAFLVANRGILVRETSFSLEQLRSVMDLYTTGMDQVATTTLKKNRIIKDYEKQIAALQKQLADRMGRQQLPSGLISATVQSGKAVQGRLTISYVTGNAGWYPSYDLRVDDITKPVTIYYKANVFQNTGVDWKDVKLSFSNATPQVSGNLPELSAWFIDYYNPVVISAAGTTRRNAAPMKAGEAMMEMAVAADMMERVAEQEAYAPAVEVKPGQTTVSFDVSIPFSVPSDGKVQTLEIQRTSTPAEYRYLTIPKLAPHAYLTGNITNWAQQSLIGGEANLYFENTFVGKSFLDVNQMTDTLTVSLGTDNSILVKREKREDFTSRRVLGQNKTETYSFLITLRNNKAVPVRMAVKDQIPVSTNSGIEVSAGELSRGSYNSTTGEVRWDLELKPGETRELIMTYSVRYPKERTIILE